MLHPWKKACRAAMREQDSAKQKELFAKASEAMHTHALELTHDLAELEQARCQLTIRALKTNNKPI